MAAHGAIFLFIEPATSPAAIATPTEATSGAQQSHQSPANLPKFVTQNSASTAPPQFGTKPLAFMVARGIGGANEQVRAEMTRIPTLKLGQKWPASYPDNKYWIGANPMSSGLTHPDGLIVLGHECTTLAELEAVAAAIRTDLERVVNEARKKLGKNSN